MRSCGICIMNLETIFHGGERVWWKAWSCSILLENSIELEEGERMEKILIWEFIQRKEGYSKEVGSSSKLTCTKKCID